MLLDVRLRDGDGVAFLQSLREEEGVRLPIIVATAYGDGERAILAMKHGAFEYVMKPFDLDALLAILARAVTVPSVAQVVGQTDTPFVGASAPMLEVWKAIGRAASSDVPVLITGESGVGKDVVAQTIHAHSARASSPFMAVNVAALSSGVIESELFGHERGAFTGATQARAGRFELAGSGVIFLDEIGDLDLALQAKLLRVLENGVFERVGGSTALRSKARVMAATARPVKPGSTESSLRDDLFYRLSVIHIDVPPLRKRRSDIPLLVDAFLGRGPHPRKVSEAAMEALAAHDWPGNVRQLRHVLEHSRVMSSADVLDLADLKIALPRHAPTVDAASEDLHLPSQLERLERQLILRALQRAEGNRAQAARWLGIRRAQLYARAKALGIDSAEKPEDEC